MICLNCTYPLAKLPQHRCPECGSAFDPADPRTFAIKSAAIRPGLPVAAAFLGLCCAFALIAVVTIALELRHPPHLARDPHHLLTPALFAGAWWLLLVVPLLLTRLAELLRRPARAVLLGCVYAPLTSFLLLRAANQLPLKPHLDPLLSFAHNAPLHFTHASATLGAATALAVSVALARRDLRSAAGPPRATVVACAGAPFLAAACWLLLIWPTLCRLAPDFAFRIADSRTREWLVHQALDAAHPGDPATLLTDRLPIVFDPPRELLYSPYYAPRPGVQVWMNSHAPDYIRTDTTTIAWRFHFSDWRIRNVAIRGDVIISRAP